MNKTRTISLLCIVSMVLTACLDSGTRGTNPNQRATQGAIVGAIAGGLIGRETGDNSTERRQRATVGAIIGAGVGAAIGHSLDRQAAELERDLGDERIDIANNGDHLLVRLPQDILFETDSASVQPGLRRDLQILADNLRRYPDSTVDVVGHTDSDGSASYNFSLSQRRADSVASELIGYGVERLRIRSYGRGEDEPVATNLTEEGKSLNRRVDITIHPNA